MGFVLFVLLNAVLFIRLEELWPESAGLRLYLIVISLAALLSLPDVLHHLRPSEIAKRPITVCVFGLFLATALSLLARGRGDDAAELVPEFGKVVVYYLLMVSVVNTP